VIECCPWRDIARFAYLSMGFALYLSNPAVVHTVLIWALLATGIILLILGWRGTRRGYQPHCRKCDFNLTGLPEETETCPECGANLLSSRAKVRGKRVRRRWLMVVALLPLLIGGGLLFRIAQEINYYPYAPNVLLIAMLDSDAARKEVATRISDGRLDGSLAASAATKALDVQGDPSKKWDDSWGKIIEQAAAAGLLMPEDIERYARQGGIIAIQVRPKVQVGRIPKASVRTKGRGRLGPATSVNMLVYGRQFFINGEPVALPETRDGWISNLNLGHIREGNPAYGLPMKSFESQLGETSLKLEIETQYKLMVGSQTFTPFKGKAQTLTATIQVVDHLTGHYVGPDARAIEERAKGAWIWLEKAKGESQIYLTFGLKQPDPIPDPAIWVRAAGGPYVNMSSSARMKMSYVGRGEHGESHAINIERLRRQFPTATHVDLIVRVNVEIEETKGYLILSESPWLGEWVFRNVPLNVEPQDAHDFLGERNPTSLVPAEARNLTREEVERPPRD